MNRFEWVAAAVAIVFAQVVVLVARRHGRVRQQPPVGARIVLWLAIAAPIPFLMLPPTSLPRLLLWKQTASFEALRLLALAAALAGASFSLWPVLRTWGGTTLAILGACVLALAAAVGVLALH